MCFNVTAEAGLAVNSFHLEFSEGNYNALCFRDKRPCVDIESLAIPK
jgi:hypothetical protein